MRTIENPDIFRKNVIVKLNELFQNEKQSSNLEKGIYNYSLKEAASRKVVKKWDNPFYVQLYVDRLRSIYINLKNPELIEQIKSGAIKAHVVAFMTHQEMNHEKWDALIDKKIKRDKSKYETTLEANTDTFTCRKCRSKKCNYYALQVRSSDEPMTLYITCLDCGNRFKQ